MSSNDVIDAGHLALPEIARKINTTVVEAEQHARGALQNALAAGALLNQAKQLVDHGKWEDWLVENCHVAPRTARGYMRLAKRYPLLQEPDRQRVADLPLRNAISAIATDPAPPARQASIPMILDRDQRDRVVEKFQSTAKTIREASKWISHGMDLKGAKVGSLRSKLQEMLTELDRLQQGGGNEL